MAEATGTSGYTPPLGTETFHFRDDGRIPNSQLPLIIRRGTVTPDAGDPARSFERLFAGNGWTGSWRNGIYDYHHYHSTAHEVLGVAEGSAEVRFGGDGGATVPIKTGDVIVIPAGVGHALVSGDRALVVVGAYADGRDWDVVRADAGSIEAARQRIVEVPLPQTDPVDGVDGPVVRLWGG